METKTPRPGHADHHKNTCDLKKRLAPGRLEQPTEKIYYGELWNAGVEKTDGVVKNIGWPHSYSMGQKIR